MGVMTIYTQTWRPDADTISDVLDDEEGQAWYDYDGFESCTRASIGRTWDVIRAISSALTQEQKDQIAKELGWSVNPNASEEAP